jgi:hypothetical protein
VLTFGYFSIKYLMNIFEPTGAFEYDKITLANPQPVQGGSYFTKVTVADDKPLYLQFPKCITKQAIVTTKRGKYCDIMYERDRHEELINWIENFENACQERLNDKKEMWFHSDLSRDDIESMMSPIARMYKSGKYILIRTYINSSKQTGQDKCMAYDENETIIELDLIEPDRYIIPLLLIDGIKFSSRSFEIDIKLTQIMVLDNVVEITNTCMIRHAKPDKLINADTAVADITDTEVADITDTEVADITEDNNKDSAVVLDTLGDSDECILHNVCGGQTSVEHLEKIQDTHDIENVEESAANDGEQLESPSIKEEPSNEQLNSPPSNLDETVEQTLGKTEEGINMLEEVTLEIDDNIESITLKNPNEVYYEIYRAARVKAKHMRQVAVEAHLEAKEIKSKYMLSDIDDSDDDFDFIPGSYEREDSGLEEN